MAAVTKSEAAKLAAAVYSAMGTLGLKKSKAIQSVAVTSGRGREVWRGAKVSKVVRAEKCERQCGRFLRSFCPRRPRFFFSSSEVVRRAVNGLYKEELPSVGRKSGKPKNFAASCIAARKRKSRSVAHKFENGSGKSS